VRALAHLGSGKVREIYEVDDDRLLLVATDRISAFDVVLDTPITHKGRVLTGLSVHWFDTLGIAHHLLSTDPTDVPGATPKDREYLAGRMMLVRRAEVIPMECVVRGYLYGSSWAEYRAGGGPTTEHLPPGLDQASRLDTALFTPATKASDGHDQNLTEAEAREYVGSARYEELRKLSLDLYARGAEYAAARGIILADTKFEFGLVGEELLLIDEALTPDSSRYWPAEVWAPGRSMPSLDKQPVRDWLEQQPWDQTPPAPPLPNQVAADTTRRYVTAYELLTGERFDAYLARTGVA
jgi:phosphoribosylaminoimidazole-succinocarboxamide synthase